MKRISTAFALVLAFGLTGCDGQKSPAGAGVSSTESSGTSQASGIRTAKELAALKARENTIETPAVPLMFKAISQMIPNGDTGGLMGSKAQHVICKYAEIKPFNYRGYYMDLMGVSVDPDSPFDASAFSFKDQARIAATCSAFKILKLVQPQNGWMFTDAPSQSRYLHGFVSNARAAAETLTPLAMALAALPGLTEQQYIDQIQKAFIAAAPDYEKRFHDNLWAYGEDPELKGFPKPQAFRIDLTGKSAFPLHGYTSTADIGIGPTGVTLTELGRQVLGAGYLNGSVFTFSVRQGNTATIKRNSDASSQHDTGNSTETNAAAKTN